jgi:hypothetical protein
LSFRRALVNLSDKLKFVGPAQPAQIGSDRAKASGTQKIDLFAPHRTIKRKAVKENNRWPIGWLLEFHFVFKFGKKCSLSKDTSPRYSLSG